MPDTTTNKNVSSPWGDLAFEAVAAPLSDKHRSGGTEGAPTAAPSHCANGKTRARRAAQFMPFAALTGYYDLIREQEWMAWERFGEGDGAIRPVEDGKRAKKMN